MEILAPQNPELEALDRLGDEIALLSARLEIATARLLDLIRNFDARRFASAVRSGSDRRRPLRAP